VVAIIHRADDVTEVVEQSGRDAEQSTDTSFLRNSAMLQRSAEIQEANRLLRLADSAKNDFLSRMSHELRTPLNAIIGFAQLMQLANLPAEEQESADHILKAGRHLLSLINDVLDLSGIESGHVQLSLEAVELQSVVHEVVDLLGSLAAARGIVLVTADVPPVVVRADRQRLKQVLLNLISNAIKYNQAGGRVSCLVREGTSRLEIGVQDSGPGISPEHQARLFTPFDRLGAEQSEIEGTGLGLALSRTLIEAMGGSIRLDSTVGQGSTFWLALERAKEATEIAHPTVVDDRPGYVDAAGTLLYIEDNLANTKLMERVVARFSSIRLITALQGSMAVELAQSQHPGLILLDLNLPDVAGEVVLARLKAEPRTRHIPVVVVSADASPRQAERLREKGALAYLTKPFDLGELMDLVGSHFAAASSERGDVL
jgi:signal transduction histidine kinase/CheY-like chemotaxis protein